MGRAVTFKGAADHPHCGPMTRTATQTTVNVNNIPVSREGDPNTPHLIPNATPCGTHAATITTGSLTVFVGGKGIGRVLDDVGAATCTYVSEGSPTVYAGG